MSTASIRCELEGRAQGREETSIRENRNQRHSQQIGLLRGFEGIYVASAVCRKSGDFVLGLRSALSLEPLTPKGSTPTKAVVSCLLRTDEEEVGVGNASERSNGGFFFYVSWINTHVRESFSNEMTSALPLRAGSRRADYCCRFDFKQASTSTP